jgi:hypothetical protein
MSLPSGRSCFGVPEPTEVAGANALADLVEHRALSRRRRLRRGFAVRLLMAQETVQLAEQELARAAGLLIHLGEAFETGDDRRRRKRAAGETKPCHQRAGEPAAPGATNHR